MWPCSPNFYAEIIYKHVSAGDSVSILKCEAVLKRTCTITDRFAPPHAAVGCEKCMAAFNNMVADYNIPRDRISCLPANENKDIPAYAFQSTRELCDWTFDGIDLGAVVLNNLASAYFDHDPDLDSCREEMNYLIEDGIYLSKTFDGIVNNFSKIYLFGGRGVANGVPPRICKKKGIDFTAIEYGYLQDTIAFYENTYPQDRDNTRKNISRLWQAASDEKVRIAESFFTERRLGTGDVSFTFLQRQGELPAGYEPGRINIAVYDSSLLEGRGLPEFENASFPSLYFLHYVYLLANFFKDDGQYKFYLRAHPTRAKTYTAMGTVFTASAQARQLRVLRFAGLKNLHVVLPHEPVGTYALLDHSDIVLLSSSTIGLEATYWGKPSISPGSTFYDHSDACYFPKTHEELVQLLKTPSLRPKPRESVLPAAYYLKMFGEPFSLPESWSWNAKPRPAPLKVAPRERLRSRLGRCKHRLKAWLGLSPEQVTEQGAEEPVNDAAEAFYAQRPTPAEIEKFAQECKYLCEKWRIPPGVV